MKIKIELTLDGAKDAQDAQDAAENLTRFLTGCKIATGYTEKGTIKTMKIIKVKIPREAHNG